MPAMSWRLAPLRDSRRLSRPAPVTFMQRRDLPIAKVQNGEEDHVLELAERFPSHRAPAFVVTELRFGV